MIEQHTNKRTRLSQDGFTMIELLVVISILVLLAGVAGPAVLKQFGGAKSKTALLQIRDLEQATEMYLLDVGRYPSNDEGLAALVKRPGSVTGWNGPYLKKAELPLDPWQREYQYKYPGEKGEVDIYSLGKNGSPGGEGEDADIGNWQ